MMKGVKLGLERMRGLMHQLNDPQDNLKFIHVAGTNGKGSTCAFFASMLTANGYKVGMYTSPAVMDAREQYTINGSWITAEDYARYAAKACAADVALIAPDNEQTDSPTEFEIETAMAFLYFYDQGCDYVVLETGLGGEGDATNIVTTTVLTILTSISEDHLGMIGNILSEIAKTKSGIIKPGVPAVMISNPPEAESVIRNECEIKGSQLMIVDPKAAETEFNLKATGTYQKDNAILALKALEVLKANDKNLKLDMKMAIDALNNTTIPFRMEMICDKPPFFLDGAHNPDAARRLKETLTEMLPDHKLIFILGMFKDKDYGEVVRIMVPMASDIFTVETPDNERALNAGELRDCIIKTQGSPDKENVKACTIEEAVSQSIAKAGEYIDKGDRPCIIAFGSLSYLKHIKKCINVVQ
ncbi:MAG: bifunctional folylpolyglutamate synthase/dihydrofolate synthase [Lachnospiraceae bacterium]|nr:bifunctional folylpolyglutamate synthase/dihydrofolate synthase [Lachnospiraceae bacterium]